MADHHHDPAQVQTASDRRPLKNRRECDGFDFGLGGLSYHATVSGFPDGTPAEIFLNAAKTDSSADISARDSAIAISLALQHGTPLDVLRKALMRDARGGPSGPAAYVLDAIAAETGGAE